LDDCHITFGIDGNQPDILELAVKDLFTHTPVHCGYREIEMGQCPARSIAVQLISYIWEVSAVAERGCAFGLDPDTFPSISGLKHRCRRAAAFEYHDINEELAVQFGMWDNAFPDIAEFPARMMLYLGFVRS